jgi:hypothetical protein
VKCCGQISIQLNGSHLSTGGQQGTSQNPFARADLQQPITGMHGNGPNQSIDDLIINKKVLTKALARPMRLHAKP